MIFKLKNLIQNTLAHAGFRKYFANTSWMFAEQILRIISGLLVGIWVARYLGPEQFGIFSYALAFVAIFSAFAKLGLDSVLVRDLVNEPDKRDEYLGTAFWLKLIAGLVTFIIVTLATLFTSNDSTTNIYILIIAGGIIFQSMEVVDFYFQSKVLSKFVSISKITQLLISSLLKVYLVLNGSDLLWFVVVSFVDQFALAITLFIAYKYQKIGSFLHCFSIDSAKELIKTCWPLVFSGLVVAIYMRVDQLMINYYLGSKSVGIFTAATRLSEFWYFVPMIISKSLFTSLINSKSSSVDLYYKRLQQLINFMVRFALFIALLTTICSGWLINIVYGAEYSEGARVLSIHIWGIIFVFFGCAWNNWIISEGFQKTALQIVVLSMLSNILLNLILIPRLGIEGAALATTLSYGLGHIFFALFFPNQKVVVGMLIEALFYKRNSIKKN